MFEKTIIDIELEKRIALNRKEIETKFQISFDKLDFALSQIAEGVAYCNLTKWKDVEEVWNVAGFITMTYYDLKILLKELTISDNEWRKRYFARQACLLIYEAIEDVPKLIGRKFTTQIVALLSKSEIHIEQLRQIKQAISEYNNKHKPLLSKIRHSCIAHREHRMLDQIKLINQISWQTILPLVSEFDTILFDLVQTLMNKSQLEFKKQ
ncbi:hypothetical protein TH61_04230 [Rufibacter sp. DG15C]|uniref:hypothetical protein n=1 Tax=Rufibacter sp. DG15C TaxID=1379909 RepID=UPI00078E8395|nr:hypothetical protein [Rufibacter sp. DG15C]AMM50540.1 hypothetical protein TH61_04230 [Rufibacter sp. DG15C]